MMEDRWRTTRARLTSESLPAEAPELWGRIAASRRAGTTADLPASDPRRAVSPVLVAVLLLVVVAAGAIHRQRTAGILAGSTSGVQASSDPEAAALDWLTTPAYAQGTGISSLPPIDPPDLSRMVPARLVYEHMDGADGILTQHAGTDTAWVSRDTVDGEPRLLLSRTNRKGNQYSDTDAIDSLAIGSDGRLLFWRWQITNARNNRVVVVSTTLLPDSVRFTTVRPDTTKVRVRPGNYEYQAHDLLLAMLPSLRLERGYARSLSVLDLLGGERTPAFTRFIELRVTGKEWLPVPGGRFHCWVVEYSIVPEPGEKRHTNTLYVDMESGTLVKAQWRGSTYYAEQTLIDRASE